jgi:hypothetical protein
MHSIDLDASRPGRLTLLIADGGPRGSGNGPGGCAITARDTSRELTIRPIAPSSYRWLRKMSVEVARPGRVRIDVGPCPKPPFFDLL